jgi:peptidoglycan/LPS O-acetylase OafA/YrhL
MRRIQELDLLRFAAAIAVVLFHYGMNFHFWLAGESVMQYGFLGVELFFMISGFVILQTAVNKDAYEFLVSRVSRLYPTFWCCLLIGIAMSGGIRLRDLFANATMAPRLFHTEPYDVVYWTLFVEMKFYALILLLIVFKQIGRIELYLRVWVLGCVVEAMTGWDWLTTLTLGEYGPYFIAGCSLYLIYTGGPNLARLLVLLASLGVAVSEVSALSVDYMRTNPPTMILGSIILAIFGIFLLVATSRIKVPPSKLWMQLGLLTYPLYLIHWKPGTIVWDRLPGSMSAPLRTAIVAGFALSVAALIAMTIERRGCKRLSAFLLGRRPLALFFGASRRIDGQEG